jgi:hypothetical protein
MRSTTTKSSFPRQYQQEVPKEVAAVQIMIQKLKLQRLLV